MRRISSPASLVLFASGGDVGLSVGKKSERGFESDRIVNHGRRLKTSRNRIQVTYVTGILNEVGEEVEGRDKSKGVGGGSKRKRDAQRQYVVIGTLAPILLNFYLCYEVIGAAAPKGAMSC